MVSTLSLATEIFVAIDNIPPQSSYPKGRGLPFVPIPSLRPIFRLWSLGARADPSRYSEVSSSPSDAMVTAICWIWGTQWGPADVSTVHSMPLVSNTQPTGGDIIITVWGNVLQITIIVFRVHIVGDFSRTFSKLHAPFLYLILINLKLNQLYLPTSKFHFVFSLKLHSNPKQHTNFNTIWTIHFGKKFYVWIFCYLGAWHWKARRGHGSC